MRGKHETELARHDRHGITPADAGKTFFVCRTTVLHEDHPRGCGENSALVTIVMLLLGSPPRMRGKQLRFGLWCPATRITPADAGKTCVAAQARVIHRDHPRGCGENLLKRANLSAALGSPPRMRGKLQQCRRFPISARITPADAGKTSSSFA